MNITDHQFMQSLNVTKLTPEQLVHGLPNYTMVNHDSLREQTCKNSPYSMPTWFIITVLATLISIIGIMILLHFKSKCTSNQSSPSAMF